MERLRWFQRLRERPKLFLEADVGDSEESDGCGCEQDVHFASKAMSLGTVVRSGTMPNDQANHVAAHG